MENPGDGIYKTRSNWYHQTSWPDNRNVYIQGNTVRLVDYIPYGETEYKATCFNFDYFFDANALGERIGDLPVNFNIKE